MFLDVNLAPIHLCEKLIDELYQAKKKEYIIKEKGDGRLVSAGLLVDEDLGPAIRTFRKNEEEKSRFPHIFWQK